VLIGDCTYVKCQTVKGRNQARRAQLTRRSGVAYPQGGVNDRMEYYIKGEKGKGEQQSVAESWGEKIRW
jgi:hypothetical protein